MDSLFLFSSVSWFLLMVYSIILDWKKSVSFVTEKRTASISEYFKSFFFYITFAVVCIILSFTAESSTTIRLGLFALGILGCIFSTLDVTQLHLLFRKNNAPLQYEVERLVFTERAVKPFNWLRNISYVAMFFATTALAYITQKDATAFPYVSALPAGFGLATALGIFDGTYKRIPERFVVIGMVLALSLAVITGFQFSNDYVIVALYLSCFLVGKGLFELVTGKDMMGYGDWPQFTIFAFLFHSHVIGFIIINALFVSIKAVPMMFGWNKSGDRVVPLFFAAPFSVISLAILSYFFAF